MNLVYKFIEQTADTITFADVLNPVNFLRFKATRKAFVQNGVSVPTVTTNTLLSFDEDVSKCADACAATATLQRTVRVITTGKSGDGDTLVKDLEMMIAYVKSNPSYFNGFKPVSGTDITLVPVV